MEKDRKLEHIQLAFDSQTTKLEQDHRFVYEPMLSGHPIKKLSPIQFLGKTMNAPIWISSMTGGTGIAKTINRNIAKACRDFGLGMGLGSCRKLLFDKTHWDDFDVRDVIGNDRPLWANLGIAQIESSLDEKSEKAIQDLVGNLRADGLVVHVNPLQEWFQPEGDQIKRPPIEIIEELLSRIDIPVIVKEVGQGMGEKSLKRLLQLPLAAIEFAAYGGTNFSKLELLRDDPAQFELYQPFAYVGQTAEQMVCSVNKLIHEMDEIKCKELIISGGVKNYLDGYYLISLSQLNSVYGMASSVLKKATGEYAELQEYISNQIKAFQLAQAFLRVKLKHEE
ncbi:isopentenyl-diphosphate delta-isomerase [Sunxiuqinia sp. A32]|uniref:isopentenyl-diphosphate delta-isomerase n=1 Tax=Sunxiuqinia sp. A32 TaxID=3461496 RepID=UPI0040452143